MTLNASVEMTISATVYQLTTLSMLSAFTPLVIQPGMSGVGFLTPITATLPLPLVSAHLISLPAGNYEGDVIRYNLSSEGDVRSGAGLNTLDF